MLITVNGVIIDDRGSFQIAKINFTGDGKTSTRNVVSSKKFVYPVLSKAQAGETFEVTEAKNDKGYDEFVSAKKADSSQAASSGASKSTSSATASPRSTYETPEERAARQVYIIRQSSLSNATAILSVGAKSLKVSDVIATAKELEDFVFGKKKTTIEEIESEMVEFDMPTVE